MFGWRDDSPLGHHHPAHTTTREQHQAMEEEKEEYNVSGYPEFVWFKVCLFKVKCLLFLLFLCLIIAREWKYQYLISDFPQLKVM